MCSEMIVLANSCIIDDWETIALIFGAATALAVIVGTLISLIFTSIRERG